MKRFLNFYLPTFLSITLITAGGFFWLNVHNAQAVVTVTFMEPGGDADFQPPMAVLNISFWSVKNGSPLPTTATDFVHGNHKKSINYPAGGAASCFLQKTGILADTGSRVSLYIYLNALPTATANIFAFYNSVGTQKVAVRLTSAGVLQLWDAANAQIGTNGSTLSTGTWYRISLAYTITNTTTNEFRLFKNGSLDISVTNATLTGTGTNAWRIGNINTDATLDMRSSDHYADNSSSLTDTGNIWVTAKRPIANGTNNQWTTQVGSGGSGYGTGHSPQVNERAQSDVNGWSIQSASLQTEEYSIESVSQGDIDITGATIVDFMGWVNANVGSNSTGNIIVAGTASNISVTTGEKYFTKVAGSTTYPAGNTDIGIDNNSVNQLFSLYEAGIIVAYIPAAAVVVPPVTRGLLIENSKVKIMNAKIKLQFQ